MAYEDQRKVINKLREAENEINKEPCKYCNKGWYRDLKGMSIATDYYPFCPKCGRDLRTK
jgi:predicted  nucleic acid-binding Zn ribbon protein